MKRGDSVSGANLATTAHRIRELLQVVPQLELAEAVIFGSAAITLNGIELSRAVDDLDLFVSDAAYERLRIWGTEVSKTSGLRFLRIGNLKVEMWKTFPAVDHAGVLARATVLCNSQGLLVASLEDIVTCKRGQDRPKDRADLRDMGVTEQ